MKSLSMASARILVSLLSLPAAAILDISASDTEVDTTRCIRRQDSHTLPLWLVCVTGDKCTSDRTRSIETRQMGEGFDEPLLSTSSAPSTPGRPADGRGVAGAGRTRPVGGLECSHSLIRHVVSRIYKLSCSISSSLPMTSKAFSACSSSDQYNARSTNMEVATEFRCSSHFSPGLFQSFPQTSSCWLKRSDRADTCSSADATSFMSSSFISGSMSLNLDAPALSFL